MCLHWERALLRVADDARARTLSEATQLHSGCCQRPWAVEAPTAALRGSKLGASGALPRAGGTGLEASVQNGR